MTVTNNNGGGCDASPIGFSAVAPSGWPSSLSTTAVASLAPGASASSTLSLQSPVGQAGTFTFSASATDTANNLSGSAAGSATLVGPLTVSASAVYTAGTRSRSATVTVDVKSGASPVPGAAVTITITKPSGARVTLSATTASNGLATAKYSLNRKDGSGTYGVSAVASSSGSTGSGTTSFVVP